MQKTMQGSKSVTWEVADAIGVLALNNPPQNLISEPDFADLALVRQWMDDDMVKGVIITGAGRHFSAGADLARLRDLAADRNLLASKIRLGKELLDYIDRMEKPVVAAITGACFGAGLEIALACHIRVCGTNALLAFPESTHNLVPGLGGTLRLPRRIGRARSMEMILCGDIVDADAALKLGLVEHVVKQKEVFDYSLSLMKKMVDGKPLRVIRSVMRALNNGRTLSERDAMDEETKMFCNLAAVMHE